jgi:hypothetical protein
MIARSLAAVAALWLMACASGGDAGDDGAGGPGLGDADTSSDGGSTVDSSAVRGGGDSGRGGTVDSGGATGADSSIEDDDSGTQGDDSGSETQDSGGGVADTGSPAPDGGSTSPICDSSNPIYAAEAAAEVLSGHFTLCLSGTGCSASQCCYEELNPGNICVAR